MFIDYNLSGTVGKEAGVIKRGANIEMDNVAL